jgi:hypothetical protein
VKDFEMKKALGRPSCCGKVIIEGDVTGIGRRTRTLRN